MFIRKDGAFFPVVYNVSPLRRDGAIVGIVVGFRDDTQRQEAERAIRNSEEATAKDWTDRALTARDTGLGRWHSVPHSQ